MAFIFPALFGTAGTAAVAGTAGSAAASLAAATGAGGAAGTAALAGTAAKAATAGLLGAGGAFSAGQALMTLSTGMGMMGQLQAGQAQSSAAAYNAKMTQMQSKMEIDRIRRQSARHQSALRVNIAKSGVTSEGTPLMVLAESEANAEIDALNTQWSADRQVDLYKMQGKSAKRASQIGAGSSLLAGAGRLYG